MQNNPIISMLMNQIKLKDPQNYQNLNQLMNNGGKPEQILQQEIKKRTPQEIQQVLIQAKQLGVPENILAQIQNMQR